VPEKKTLEYGVLLPHFGSEYKRERIIDASIAIERYGFDAIFSRDHVVFTPHGHEDQDNTFVDPFVVLSAVAAVTKRIKLGTASLVPHRHPVQAALMASSVELLAGAGRLLLGWGLGSFDNEFEAVGMGAIDRRKLLPEQIGIMRRLLAGETVTFEGEFYSFKDVSIRQIAGSHIPLWYCGTSEASARRAVEYCDGWLGGAVPRKTYRMRVERMKAVAAKLGKPLPRTGLIPFVSPGRTVEEASAKIDVAGLLHTFSSRGHQPEVNATFETLADSGGAVIAGPADVIIEETRKYQASGVELLVFDLRHRFKDFEYCVDYLGTNVIPALKREDGTAR
jgi:alkanesulfonate monooxygenase SsuD/methylene tetrahydromethanopterin reductase-like flavin-dependent oxidoreductase (luciferase family)